MTLRDINIYSLSKKSITIFNNFSMGLVKLYIVWLLEKSIRFTLRKGSNIYIDTSPSILCILVEQMDAQHDFSYMHRE
jgi:hypothetical protein